MHTFKNKKRKKLLKNIQAQKVKTRQNKNSSKKTYLPITLVAISVCPVVRAGALSEVEAVLPFVPVAVRERLHSPTVSLIIVPPVKRKRTNTKPMRRVR